MERNLTWSVSLALGHHFNLCFVIISHGFKPISWFKINDRSTNFSLFWPLETYSRKQGYIYIYMYLIFLLTKLRANVTLVDGSSFDLYLMTILEYFRV